MDIRLGNMSDCNKMLHKIDLRGVTACWLSQPQCAPPRQPILLQALNRSVCLQLCHRTAGVHFIKEMRGLILVEPPEGLPKVNELHVMQSDS